MFNFAKYFVNYSGRKDFPFVAMTASGITLGYFKNSNDAGKYLDGVGEIAKIQRKSFTMIC